MTHIHIHNSKGVHCPLLPITVGIPVVWNNLSHLPSGMGNVYIKPTTNNPPNYIGGTNETTKT